MSKHTPRPWHAAERGDYSDLGGNSRVILGNDRRIAIVQHNGSAEDDANAYLFAAAPDLLEACKEFCRKVESGEAKSSRSYAQMKAAIAKAEGDDDARIY